MMSNLHVLDRRFLGEKKVEMVEEGWLGKGRKRGNK